MGDYSAHRVSSEGLVPAGRAFLGIALPEEAVKAAVIVWAGRRRRDFGCLMDGAVYGVSAAMGFALLENILYLAGAGEPTGAALQRGFTAVPLHALTGGFMGLAVGRVRIECGGSLSGAFLSAVLLHGAYDWFLIDPGLPSPLIFVLLVIGWGVLLTALGRARRADESSGRLKSAGCIDPQRPSLRRSRPNRPTRRQFTGRSAGQFTEVTFLQRSRAVRPVSRRLKYSGAGRFVQDSIVFAALGQHVKPQFAGLLFDVLLTTRAPTPAYSL